ncbi:endoglucanase [Arthrobacter sp. CAN_A214]
MLIALGMEDEKQFDSIWSWTEENILSSNGLLAWRWNDGMIVDQGPAADADLDAARALIQAGEHFDRPDLTDDGNLLASKIMDQLSAVVPDGRVLLPGLWATKGPDYIYNPSYASPGAFTILAESTGDPRWEELLAGSHAVTAVLLTESPLPPDWAQIKADGNITAMPGPEGTGPSARYSYDATRLPIRYAESCNTKDVALAASLAPTLDRANPLLTTLDLGGTSLESDQNPVAYAARASARAAAGNISASRADLQRADDLDVLYPSYYGSAWAALGRIMLDSTILGGCPALTE